jgi:hypothetical protein
LSNDFLPFPVKILIECEKALSYIEAIGENDDFPYDNIEYLKNRFECIRDYSKINIQNQKEAM